MSQLVTSSSGTFSPHAIEASLALYGDGTRVTASAFSVEAALEVNGWISAFTSGWNTACVGDVHCHNRVKPSSGAKAVAG